MQRGRKERRTGTVFAQGRRTTGSTQANGNTASRQAACTHGQPVTHTRVNGEPENETASASRTKADGSTKVLSRMHYAEAGELAAERELSFSIGCCSCGHERLLLRVRRRTRWLHLVLFAHLAISSAAGSCASGPKCSSGTFLHFSAACLQFRALHIKKVFHYAFSANFHDHCS